MNDLYEAISDGAEDTEVTLEAVERKVTGATPLEQAWTGVVSRIGYSIRESDTTRQGE